MHTQIQTRAHAARQAADFICVDWGSGGDEQARKTLKGNYVGVCLCVCVFAHMGVRRDDRHTYGCQYFYVFNLFKINIMAHRGRGS